ncbi:MAG: hypothetical protein LHV68_06710 [Elusimicrobia bacterium]|nr:hypothetical protein [Candidatus Liberimonas magnetica]
MRYIYSKPLFREFLILFCFILLSGQSIAEETSSRQNKNVLIVSNKARPDDAVILQITELLKKEGCVVASTATKSLKNGLARKYGAIVVLNFVASKKRLGSVKVFLDRDNQKKLVLFNAVGEDYLGSLAGQKTEKAGKIASRIVEKVREILLKQ